MKETVKGQPLTPGREEKRTRKAAQAGLGTLGNQQLSGLLSAQGNGAEYARRYLVNGISRRAPDASRRPPATAASRGPARPHANSLRAQPEPVKHGSGLEQDTGELALQRLVSAGVIQPKLQVGRPDDPLEAEADRVAQQVMRMPEPVALGSCACGGTCAECSQSSPPKVQRKATAKAGAYSPPSHSGAVPTGGRSLDRGTRSFFEGRFSHDFSSVRIHTGAEASGLAHSLRAKAYTVGQDVVFGQNQFQPDTSAGRHLLAHELAHTIQQGSGHSGYELVQRYDWAGADDLGMGDWAAEQAERRAEAARRHTAWGTSVDRQFGPELTGQAPTIGAERERIDFALTGQRAAAFDAVAGGQGWLGGALEEQGYSGPSVLDVKQKWAEALVAAELLKAASSASEVSTESRLEGLETIPAFYHDIGILAPAVEQAHRTHVQSTNERLRTQYERQLAAYEEGQRMDRMAYGPRGEPGEGAFRAGLALARGSPPAQPNYLTAPPEISAGIAAAASRVDAADTAAQWAGVARDVRALDAGLTRQLVDSLPQDSGIRQGIEYLTALDRRLEQFEGAHQVAFRIPAVFYPEDSTTTQTTTEGEQTTRPESIPWQFYLVNTGVTTRDQPARAGGEWVLIDLTSGQRYENRAPASDRDSAMLQQGALVDPPIGMFTALNSRIRFPEGRLYFTLPSGQSYVLRTTAPWSLSDFLTALGIALAAVALIAGVVATGGAAAPAAIAFYAGLGAAGVGIASTLADMHERNEHGILTAADVDRAMIQIGIDLVGALSMGLGRLVSLPGAAARFGSRFIVLSRITQGVRVANLGGDVYQAMTVTGGFIGAFNAIDNQPGLTDEQRERMRGQLVRRALLTGAMLTIAIRGDVGDIRSGRTLHVSGVDPDGAIVVQGRGTAGHTEADTPGTRVEAPGAPGVARAAHADVGGPVHASARQAGSELTVGPQRHAVGVGGGGPRRDFYFCSDLCAPIIDRLSTILAVLPRARGTRRAHPFRAAVQDMITRARRARRQLLSGELTQQEADAVARELSDRIQRLSTDSQHFSALMNADPALLAARPHAIRQRLRDAMDAQTAHLGEQAQRQAANTGAGRGRDPLGPRDARSPVETDILGGLAVSEAARASRGLQPIRFDVGNFSHTYAEALVPGLPRGLHPEVTVTLPDGSVGRADRVRFIYDGDGDRIGAHVYEIKPNVGDNVARGETQVQGYVDGLRAEINTALQAKGKAIPTSAPDGGPLYSGQVVTYDYDRMFSVLRALRASRRDAANMSQLEAIARQVFGAAE